MSISQETCSILKRIEPIAIMRERGNVFEVDSRSSSGVSLVCTYYLTV
jgi:hypothetical protein